MDEEDILMNKDEIMKLAKEKGISYDEMVAILKEEQDEKSDNDEKTFTQSELDRRINQAVETNSKRIKEQLEEQKQAEIEKAKSEAEEYARMTEQEKLEAKMKKRIEELEAREAQLQRNELRSQITSDLQEHKLPESLVDILVPLGDSEKIKGAIKTMRESVDEQINSAVKERLAGSVPPESGGGLPDDPIKKRIKKIKSI